MDEKLPVEMLAIPLYDAVPVELRAVLQLLATKAPDPANAKMTVKTGAVSATVNGWHVTIGRGGVTVTNAPAGE